MTNLDDCYERLLEQGSNTTWSVSHNPRQIQITSEECDGGDHYIWLTEANLAAMLKAVRQTTELHLR